MEFRFDDNPSMPMVGKPGVTIPLALHLRSPSCIDTTVLQGIYSEINRIWSAAGIGFTLETLDNNQAWGWPDWALFLANYHPPADDPTIHGYYGHWTNPPPDSQGNVRVINGISDNAKLCF
jgi:hypothetical protein